MNLVSDLVRDSRINLQYTLQGLPSYGEVDRIFVVKDIGDGDGVTQPQLFTSAALEFLQSPTGGNISTGTPHPVYAFCTARNFSVQDVDSNNAVKITVGYVYQQIPYDTTIWTIESSTYTEFLETYQQYNNSNASLAGLVPIQIANYVLEWGTYQNGSGVNASPRGQPYQTPAGAFTVQPAPAAYPSASVAKIRRRWDYVKTIYDPATAQTFDAACQNFVNCVNTVPYLGNLSGPTAQNLNLSTGTAYCADAGVSYNLTSGQYLARFSIVWKPEGWQPYAIYSNTQTGGVPANVWAAGSLNGTPYDANGVVKLIEYLSTDLNQLLTLI